MSGRFRNCPRVTGFCYSGQLHIRTGTRDMQQRQE